MLPMLSPEWLTPPPAHLVRRVGILLLLLLMMMMLLLCGQKCLRIGQQVCLLRSAWRALPHIQQVAGSCPSAVLIQGKTPSGIHWILRTPSPVIHSYYYSLYQPSGSKFSTEARLPSAADGQSRPDCDCTYQCRCAINKICGVTAGFFHPRLNHVQKLAATDAVASPDC